MIYADKRPHTELLGFILSMKTLLYFTAFISCFSCSDNTKDNELLGNWIFYSPELQYVEIYVSDSSFYIYPSGGMFPAPKYELINDSIFLIDRNTKLKHHVGNKDHNKNFQFEYYDGSVITLNIRPDLSSNEHSLEWYIENRDSLNIDEQTELYRSSRNKRETEFRRNIFTDQEFEFWQNPPDSTLIFLPDIEEEPK